MNLDNRIKNELESDAAEIDKAMAEKEGLIQFAASPFKGGLRHWMVVAYVAIAVLTVVLIWCGYRFFMAESVDQRVFWGVWFVMTVNAQGMLKLWSWMEMNRNSVIREIKRLEIAVGKLHTGNS
ncbi:DUF6768 family protein [Pseudohongiella sp. O18]|uniref:DUF6768 family protein n=1 Tax=Pseudohongiella sp. O18 TaxID=2904248 RepID=UPI001F2BCBD9|nr:DUF6768 family protein [Pseudohongiella sp. O18]